MRYSRIEDLDHALRPDLFTREPIHYRAAFLAGKALLLYRRRGGVRSSPLPDFFIGAHAAVANYRLLTRDPRRYQGVFPQARSHCAVTRWLARSPTGGENRTPNTFLKQQTDA